MAKSSDTTRLEEVKTLLHQLQRIRSEPTNSNPQDKPEGHPDQAFAGSRTVLPNRRTLSTRPVLMVAALLFLAAAITGAMLHFDKPAPEHPEPPTAAVQQPGSTEPLSSLGGTTEQQPESGAVLSLLQHAQQMMLSGDILGAREVLMKSADSGPPDVALALARSYDPNFLRSVTNPNAAPDIEQAALWYRRWHDAAVESGLVTDTLRLERILRSMR
jgi:hypothetical protein